MLHLINNSAKIIIIQSTWHSKITLFQQYEYIDEMLEGPFIKWKHTHKFKRINKNKTEIIDKVEFSLPYGLFGKIVSIFFTKILRFQLIHLIYYHFSTTRTCLILSLVCCYLM